MFAAYPGMKVIHRAGRVHSNIDPISRLRRRIPIHEGPVSDVIPHLVMTNEASPIKSLYNEIGDRFEAKVLAVAAIHARKNLRLKGNIRDGTPVFCRNPAPAPARRYAGFRRNPACTAGTAGLCGYAGMTVHKCLHSYSSSVAYYACM